MPWREEDHPRVPAGSPEGGQFTFSAPLARLVGAIKDADDATFAYHATSEDRLRDIIESGRLKTHGPSFGTDQDSWPDGSRERRAYFGKGSSVWSFAPEEGKPVALRLPKIGAGLKRESGTGDLYSLKAVLATRLEALTERGWERLPARRPRKP